MSSTSVPIIIIGGGIGGLSTALALHATGFKDIHIFEAVKEIRALGVGINVQPSAVLILRNWGLLSRLEKIGRETEELRMFNRHGNYIMSEPLGRHAGYTIPQYSVHRGEFQMLLLEAVKERIGEDRVHLSHVFTSFEQDDDGITAHFTRARDSTEPAEIPSMTGAFLVAADGINSATRRLLYPDEGPPLFSGRMLWRGCLETADPRLWDTPLTWCGNADQRFIVYPITGPRGASGKALVNWIAELRTRSREEVARDAAPPVRSDWTARVDKAAFAPSFKGWVCGPGGLRPEELVGLTPDDCVFEFPMCDREPVARWSFGRLTLLGDAAHAMYPTGANGATQAIIDAETLGGFLERQVGGSARPDWAAALAGYQDQRLPATAQIVRVNRSTGPDSVLQMVEDRAPDGFEVIQDVCSKEELEGVGLRYKTLTHALKDIVNEKAKLTESLAERFN
ncbi:hypothetical protein VSDG_05320 [Cytospora chrysosperma]|uniref:FAD-binding domain-containing protein n=1 Tax=Cytospora chrysosperma TaxID=252740 RepID=A0A423VX27_CYTCH|nr:hypothetical protein VSDG_05320 [Valsa sordida]